MRLLNAAVLVAAILVMAPAAGRDFSVYPIGKPQVVRSLGIAVSYFQPIELEGSMMHAAADADIHLEVDITATKDDPDGYAEGDWRPYLVVSYRLAKAGTGQTRVGTLMPLIAYGRANVGKPHYGDNLKLMGPGRYVLELDIAPPAGPAGVTTFTPFTANYTFVYAGVGKKGGY